MLLEAGALPNQAKADGITPMLKAVSLGNTEIVRELLKHGADPNVFQRHSSPLYYAAQAGQVEMVSLLLERGAEVNFKRSDGVTPLYIAAKNGHLDVVNMLLACTDIDRDAGFRADKPSLEKLMEGKDEGVKARVNAFLETQSNADVILVTPKDIAKMMGHENIVNALMGNDEMKVVLAPPSPMEKTSNNLSPTR